VRNAETNKEETYTVLGASDGDLTGTSFLIRPPLQSLPVMKSARLFR
jgi:hypothetical protein